MMIRSYWQRLAFIFGCLACACVCRAADTPQFHPGRVIPLLGEDQQNLVPNASFECGTDGWGSVELDFLPGWYNPLNSLFGSLSPTAGFDGPDFVGPVESTPAYDGPTCLKIELGPQNQPIAYNDYFNCERRPIRAPMAANVGWIEVKPGRPYRFSVAMKAAEDETPARLVVRQFHAAPFEKFVRLSPGWKRYTLDFTPTAEACYVMAGPDLRPGKDNPYPPERAKVWLDAVRLAPEGAKPEFATRQPVEFGISTKKPGNIFAWDEPLAFRIVAVGSTDAREKQTGEIAWRLTDFFDKEVCSGTEPFIVFPGSTRSSDAFPLESPELRGFLRLHVKLTSGKTTSERTMRLAVIPEYKLEDSRFGMNHAFGWPDMLTLCRQAGLGWMRDWSPKWQDVEPKKGQFDFTETDAQIDRILKEKLQVMCVLAFPSSMWSSTAPAKIQPPIPWYNYPNKSPDPERQRDEILADAGQPYLRMGYPPRDLAEFENYVNKTVDHYKDRVQVWQVFNEPIHTDYALDGQAGYKTQDFIHYIGPFARAAHRADPNCKILGGYNIEGYHPAKGLPDTLKELERFITLGGLKDLDVFTVHVYPSLEPPEYMEQVIQRLQTVMDEHGGRKPIWFTEYGYYGDDNPWCVPIVVHFNGARLPSERVQAEYQIRFNTVLLANGVEKIFSHAGTGSSINHTNFWTMFLRYNSEPFKCYASQAVMAQYLTPSCKFVKRLLPEMPVKAYLFSDEKRTVAVIWTPEDMKAKPVQLTSPKLEMCDIMGRPISDRVFTPSASPVYVVGEGVSAEEFEKAVGPAP